MKEGSMNYVGSGGVGQGDWKPPGALGEKEYRYGLDEGKVHLKPDQEGDYSFKKEYGPAVSVGQRSRFELANEKVGFDFENVNLTPSDIVCALYYKLFVSNLSTDRDFIKQEPFLESIRSIYAESVKEEGEPDFNKLGITDLKQIIDLKFYLNPPANKGH